MFSSFILGIVSRFKKLLFISKKKPLMNSQRDLALLYRVHGKKFPRIKQLVHVGRVLSLREKRIFRISLFVFFIGFIWFGFGLIGNYRVSVPAVGGRYVEAVVGAPELVNPLFSSVNDVDQDLVRLVYSGLMHFDNKQRLLPDLAASVEVSDNKKVYTFKLREDVLWHDGKPFTSRDVVYTFDTIQNKSVGSPLFISFQGVEVESVDDYTVTFTLKEPFTPFLSSLTVGILPEHVWFDVQPERIRLVNVNLQPIGTGPFVFKKLSKDHAGYIFNYELGRYAGYYRNPAFIEEFVFQFYSGYEGDVGAISALRGQKVDGLNFVPSDLRDKATRKHIILHTLQLPQYTALFFNQNRLELLSDKDVRTALAYTLDKDRILRESIRDEGYVIYSPILPGYPGYNPEIERTPYSVDMANELLDKKWERISSVDYRKNRVGELLAEYDSAISESSDELVDGEASDVSTTTLREEKEKEINALLDSEINEAQTFYRKKDDEILSIKIVTADTQEYRNTANLIVGFWQDIGVKADVKFVNPRDISREVLKDRSYDVLLYGAIIGSDPDQYPFWHSSQIDFPGLNLSRYVNRNADTLLDKARESSDETEVSELYTQFQDLLLEDVPAIFLYTPTYTYATTDEVSGIGINRIFGPADRFSNVTDWYIKTKGNWKLGNK